MANDDNFGDAVALSGTTALIGACNKSFGDNYYTGAAYFFSGSGESWAEQAELCRSPTPATPTTSAMRSRSRVIRH